MVVQGQPLDVGDGQFQGATAGSATVTRIFYGDMYGKPGRARPEDGTGPWEARHAALRRAEAARDRLREAVAPEATGQGWRTATTPAGPGRRRARRPVRHRRAAHSRASRPAHR